MATAHGSSDSPAPEGPLSAARPSAEALASVAGGAGALARKLTKAALAWCEWTTTVVGRWPHSHVGSFEKATGGTRDEEVEV